PVRDAEPPGGERPGGAAGWGSERVARRSALRRRAGPEDHGSARRPGSAGDHVGAGALVRPPRRGGPPGGPGRGGGAMSRREIPEVSAWRSVHLIGIGGAGMSGIARLLLARDVSVRGSDLKESRNLDALREAGATVFV